MKLIFKQFYLYLSYGQKKSKQESKQAKTSSSQNREIKKGKEKISF